MEKLNKREIYLVTLSALLLLSIFLMIGTDSNCEYPEEQIEEVEENNTFVLDNKTYKKGTNQSVPEEIVNSTNPFINGSIMDNSTE